MFGSRVPPRVVPVGADYTVNLDASMAYAEMQALIDDIERYISARHGDSQPSTVTVQFADGTYALGGEELRFNGFFGGGILKIQGNTGESGKHENQAVVLQSSSAGAVVSFRGVQGVWTTMSNIRVESTAGHGVFVAFCGAGITLRGCAFEPVNTKHCVDVNTSGWFNVETSRCIGGLNGLYIGRGHMSSFDNDSKAADKPDNGLAAIYGAVIAKMGGTQPAGSVANEFTSTGGVIR